VRWGGDGVNYGGPQGLDESVHPAVRHSHSTHDMAEPWRSEEDMRQLTASWQFQIDQGHDNTPIKHQGTGLDPSVRAIIAAMKKADAEQLQGGHGHDHSHDHDHDHEGGHSHEHSHDEAPAAREVINLDWGWSGRDTEDPEERTAPDAHNWGRKINWKDGNPMPAPIISSLPVRSRSRGRWDGDGM